MLTPIDTSPGGFLDQATPAHKSTLGWWRFFEEGTPGQRSHGSSTHGFIPTGVGEGGSLEGFMIASTKTKLKSHPGVFKMGFIEKTSQMIGEEFARRQTTAIMNSVGR